MVVGICSNQSQSEAATKSLNPELSNNYLFWNSRARGIIPHYRPVKWNNAKDILAFDAFSILPVGYCLFPYPQ